MCCILEKIFLLCAAHAVRPGVFQLGVEAEGQRKGCDAKEQREVKGTGACMQLKRCSLARRSAPLTNTISSWSCSSDTAHGGS